MVNDARAGGGTWLGGGGRDGGGGGATSLQSPMTPAAQADGDGADPSADASGGLSGV